MWLTNIGIHRTPLRFTRTNYLKYQSTPPLSPYALWRIFHTCKFNSRRVSHEFGFKHGHFRINTLFIVCHSYNVAAGQNIVALTAEPREILVLSVDPPPPFDTDVGLNSHPSFRCTSHTATLPTELLCPIFLLACPEASPSYNFAWTVGLVSRHWRAVALSIPELWAIIDLSDMSTTSNPATSKITVFLQRNNGSISVSNAPKSNPLSFTSKKSAGPHWAFSVCCPSPTRRRAWQNLKFLLIFWMHFWQFVQTYRSWRNWQCTLAPLFHIFNAPPPKSQTASFFPWFRNLNLIWEYPCNASRQHIWVLTLFPAIHQLQISSALCRKFPVWHSI